MSDDTQEPSPVPRMEYTIYLGDKSRKLDLTTVEKRIKGKAHKRGIHDVTVGRGDPRSLLVRGSIDELTMLDILDKAKTNIPVDPQIQEARPVISMPLSDPHAAGKDLMLCWHCTNRLVRIMLS